MKYNLLFLDTETTGFEEQDRICQLAYQDFDGSGRLISSHCQLYNPGMLIGLVATSITHITDKMVEDAEKFNESLEYGSLKEKLESDDYVMIAHNAPFDVAMLNKEGIYPKNVIDTLKLVKHLNDPDMEKQNLQYLRYYYELDQFLSENTVIQPHDAMSDVVILDLLFGKICRLAKKTIPDDDLIKYMIKRSSDPVYISKFNFGKHLGKLVSDVAKEDMGYIDWLLNAKKQNPKGEEDWIYTLEKVKSDIK